MVVQENASVSLPLTACVRTSTVPLRTLRNQEEENVNVRNGTKVSMANLPPTAMELTTVFLRLGLLLSLSFFAWRI